MPFDCAVDRLKSARPRMDLLGIGGAGRRGQLRHHFDLHIGCCSWSRVLQLVIANRDPDAPLRRGIEIDEPRVVPCA
jgi:hypothetical protein